MSGYEIQSDGDKRKYPRMGYTFIVSYKRKGSDLYDLTQTRDISKKGAMLTTSCLFEEGTHLDMIIKLPFAYEKITITGQVVGAESIEGKKCRFYKTRVKFVDISPELTQKLGDFIDEALNNNQRKRVD